MEFPVVAGIYGTWIGEARQRLQTLRTSGAWPDQPAVMVMPASAEESFDSRFDEVFSNQLLLLEEGQVVWGQIVQANTLLFSPGQWDHPATAIWSDAATDDSGVQSLKEAARRLFGLKGQETGDPQLQRLADLLADEIEMPLRIDLPTSLTDGLPVYLTSIMVPRSHLPSGMLADMTLPLLVAPGSTDAAMVLPLAAWPEEMVEAWEEAARPDPWDGTVAGVGAIVPVGVSGLAIAAGILALTSLVLVPAPLAILVGIAAMVDIRRHPGKRGTGRAIAAIVAGVFGTICLVLLVLFVM